MKNSGIDWIGECPVPWQFLKGKYIFSLRNDKGNTIELQLLSPTQKFGIIPQTMYEELTTNTTVKVKENTDLSQFKTIHKGDFCISLRSFQGGFEYCIFEGVVSPAYQVFYPITKICDNYYKYLFKDQSFINKMNSYTLGLRDGKNIAFNDFGNTYLPMPPISEQEKISSYLDEKCAEIDALSMDIQAEIDILEEYKRSVITETVTKGMYMDELVETNHSYIKFYPKNWKFIKAGYIFKENCRPAQSNDCSLSLSQKDGLIKTDDMTEHSLKTGTYKGWKHVVKRDLVLNRFKARLGVFFSSHYDGMVSFHYGVYEAILEINSKFYEYLFHSKPYCDMFAELSNGITVGLQNLSNGNFYSAKCVYPPIEEQNEIVKYLDLKCKRIDTVIKAKAEQLVVLDDYKKSLIYEYVTGKKEVCV